MDISSKTALELYFADNFETILFTVLADHYIQDGDYERAAKVCEIGLQHHPDQPDGLYLAARAAIAQGNDVEGEQFLRRLQQCVPHFEGLRLLAGLQKHMERSLNTQASTWKKIQGISPQNESAARFFKDRTDTGDEISPAEVKEAKNIPGKKEKRTQKENVISVPISDRLTTFTMVAVLNDQGLFHQALEILDILESKGKDPARINTERKKIEGYLAGMNEEV